MILTPFFCGSFFDGDNNNAMCFYSSSKMDSFRESLFLNLIEETKNSDRVKSSRHSAAIVHKNRFILSIGHNRRKSHPQMKKYQKNKNKIFLHAEIDASIRAINLYGIDILKECDLYVLRVTQGGNIGNSRPCQGCQDFIDSVGFKNVFFTL